MTSELYNEFKDAEMNLQEKVQISLNEAAKESFPCTSRRNLIGCNIIV
jgi:hypothetical protein